MMRAIFDTDLLSWILSTYIISGDNHTQSLDTQILDTIRGTAETPYNLCRIVDKSYNTPTPKDRTTKSNPKSEFLSPPNWARLRPSLLSVSRDSILRVENTLQMVQSPLCGSWKLVHAPTPLSPSDKAPTVLPLLRCLLRYEPAVSLQY
jgi:hypothetical protein